MTDEQLNAILHKADDDLDALKDRVHDQYEEIQELKAMIDKAIEYIKDNCSYEEDTKYCYDDLCSSDVNDLLNILQGEE